MTDPQQLRAIVAAWWEDTFVNDYVIDRGGNYRSAEDCIEDIVVRARAALAQAYDAGHAAGAALERNPGSLMATEAMLAANPDTARSAHDYYTRGMEDAYRSVKDIVESRLMTSIVIERPPAPPADGEQRVMTDLTPEHTSRRTEGDLHPEVREAYKYVDSVVATADFEHPLAWCGWALREAFLAGCTHARAALPPAIISDLSFSHPQTAMAEQRSDLHQLALQALKGVHKQREEILRAFVAKYQCQPDDAVQAMQTTVEGDRHVTRYWIEKSKRMPAPPFDGEVAELMECPACEGTPKPGNQPCAVCGRHVPAPPADGEVAKLVAWLGVVSEQFRLAELTGQLIEAANGAAAMGWDQHAQRILRAVELLQRQALVPVAVAERPWEREGWCDEHGRCWFGWTDEPDASWSFCKPSERDIAVVSLPAHALPIPQQQESDNG